MKKFLGKIFAITLALCVASVPTAVLANTTKYFVLHNKTGTPISGVYFGETWSNEYGPEALGAYYINPNVEYNMSVSSGACVIDMKVHYTNGANQTLRFDVCAARHVDALPSGLSVAF